jgi:hypothetical protein
MCPKCQNTTLLYVQKVAANEDTGTIQEQPTFRLTVTGKGTQARAGNLEAYACERCGLVELYLAEPLPVDGHYVQRKTRPGQAPHRT